MSFPKRTHSDLQRGWGLDQLPLVAHVILSAKPQAQRGTRKPTAGLPPISLQPLDPPREKRWVVLYAIIHLYPDVQYVCLYVYVECKVCVCVCVVVHTGVE